MKITAQVTKLSLIFSPLSRLKLIYKFKPNKNFKEKFIYKSTYLPTFIWRFRKQLLLRKRFKPLHRKYL